MASDATALKVRCGTCEIVVNGAMSSLCYVHVSPFSMRATLAQHVNQPAHGPTPCRHAVPMSLVGPLVEVGQFKCPKCSSLQSISIPPEAKHALLHNAAAWRQRLLQAPVTTQAPNIQAMYEGGGQRAAGMLNMMQRAQQEGAQAGTTRATFDQMVHTMAEDADEEAEDNDNGATFSVRLACVGHLIRACSDGPTWKMQLRTCQDTLHQPWIPAYWNLVYMFIEGRLLPTESMYV